MTTTESNVTMGQRKRLPATLIHRGDNDRTVFDQEELQVLADSIASPIGLMNPPEVRPCGCDQQDGDHYEIVFGERRFRAMSQILGWSEIPVIVKSLDDTLARAHMLVENVNRVDLDPIDEADAYAEIMDKDGLDIDGLCKLAGVSRNRVLIRLKFRNLIPEAKDAVRSGALAIGNAPLVAQLDDHRQRMALRALASDDLSWWQFDSLCKQLAEEQAANPLFDVEDDGEFNLNVEEYVAEARTKNASPAAALRKMVKELTDALAKTGQYPELVVASRALLDGTTKVAEA